MSKIQVDSIVNKDDTGGVDFPKGVTVTGVVTATSFAGNVTGDVTGNVTGNLTGTASTASNLTAGATLSIGAGSTSAPSLAPSGDSNTGIFFPSEDTIAFAEGGSEAARIDSSRRLLIGTTSNGGAFDGINPQLQVEGTSFSTSSASLFVNTNSGSGAYLVIGKSRGTSVGSNTIVQDGDEIGGLVFAAADGTDRQTPLAYVRAEVDGTPGSNDMPGRLSFHTTANGAAVPTERMRVREDGRVFINTTTKRTNAFLAVKNTSADTILSERTGTGGETHIQFYNANGGVGSINTSGSSTSYNTSSDYRLKENVVPLTGAADRLNQLQVRRFNFIADPDTTVDGFIAHEAQAVVPEAVFGTHNEVDDEGNPVYQSIDQSKLVPLLTAALQEALDKIETLETQNTAILARLDALEAG